MIADKSASAVRRTVLRHEVESASGSFIVSLRCSCSQWVAMRRAEVLDMAVAAVRRTSWTRRTVRRFFIQSRSGRGFGSCGSVGG
jgi:hypothetical protein